MSNYLQIIYQLSIWVCSVNLEREEQRRERVRDREREREKMAETEGMRFGGSGGTPRGEHHLAGKNPFDDHELDDMHGQHWPTPTTPTFGLGHDHEYDEHDHHAKKSVLAKVKDKAKKWRQFLTRKKHGHDDDDDDAANWTPPWGVSLEEEDDDEEDPEYHGAPMYESEMAPEMYKKAEPAYGSDWIKESEMKGANDTRRREPKLRHLNSIKRTSMAFPPPVSDKRMNSVRGSTNNSASSKTMSEMVREILVPAYNIATEATYSVASKIQAADVGPRCEAGARQAWDKGMAVREYLVRKLQPGEDDRALCEVITEAVSPRNGRAAPGKGGFAETVRLAVMSSLQGREESSQGSPIPVSTNPHTTAAEEEEEEAETGGRKLQACAK